MEKAMNKYTTMYIGREEAEKIRKYAIDNGITLHQTMKLIVEHLLPRLKLVVRVEDEKDV